MKLSEIQALFCYIDAIEAEEQKIAPPTSGDEIAEQAEQHFYRLPRVKYADLPDKLKKQVRETITSEKLKAFLMEGYNIPDFLPDAVKQHEAQNPNYKTFDDITTGIETQMLDRLLIKTRNSAVYTIEREKEQFKAVLYGDHAEEAFEAVLTEYRKSQGQATPQKRERRKTDKLKKYALGGSYQWVISDPEYFHALTPQQNKHAYIALMPDSFFDKFSFDNTNSTLTYDNNMAAIIRSDSKGKYEDIKQLDIPLLTQIYTAAIKSMITNDNYTITVSIPRFFDEMGIDTQANNAADVLNKINSFSNCIGIMPERGITLKLLTILKIDLDKQEIVLAVPYLLDLYQTLNDKNIVQKELRSGDILQYEHPFHNKLVHANIASERNKTAVEVVYYITSKLFYRGFIANKDTYNRKNEMNNAEDDIIEYHVSYKTLINDCPLLRASLLNSKNRSVILRRTFTKAYDLLKTHTDVYEYFIGLEIKGIIPTMGTINRVFKATHKGRNSAYEQAK